MTVGLACLALAGRVGAVGAAGAADAPPQAGEPDPAMVRTERAFMHWQLELSRFIAGRGQGDPGVLAQLPALRSPLTARPAQIVFGVIDIEAREPGRDGCDVSGLLLGTELRSDGRAYVFVVGAVQREDSRPVAVLDVRVATLSMRGGVATWWLGPPDERALARYRRHLDADTALRFPGPADRFSLQPCEPGPCVAELGSGARWSPYREENASVATGGPQPAALDESRVSRIIPDRMVENTASSAEPPARQPPP